jgi:beta-lactamase regulating signal transducer with metallopeptidase domain
MNAFFIYQLKVMVASALFYATYRLFLSNDVHFVRNRFFLLTGVMASILVPLLHLPVITQTIYLPVSFSQLVITTIAGQPSIEKNWWPVILLMLYLLAVVFMFFRFLVASFQIKKIVVNAQKQSYQNQIVAFTTKPIIPFSIFRWIIVPDKYREHPDKAKIIRHEMVHSRQYHFVDLIMAEMLLILQCFNPFAWLMRKAIAQNHEFIVDRYLLQNGVEARSYQYALLQTVVGCKRLMMVSHFSTNILKKRITMMNKTDMPKRLWIKNGLMLLPVLSVLTLSISCDEKVVVADSDQASITHDVKIIGYGENQKTFYIDGKKVTKEELDSLSPDKINSVDIRKTDKSEANPLIILDGKVITNAGMKALDPETFQSVDVYKDEPAIEKYGEKGKDGVVVITSKK